jgi:hypothetical protein
LDESVVLDESFDTFDGSWGEKIGQNLVGWAIFCGHWAFFSQKHIWSP